MTKRASITTIHMKASEFRDLVAPVIPLAAQTDFNLPILNAVLIEGHGPNLTATATDRYRLGIQRHRLEAPGFHALVDLRALRAILRIFPATRKADPQLSITAADGKLTVESVGLDLGGITGSLSWPQVTGDYPKVSGIIEKASQAAEPGTLLLNPSLLADFKAAQRTGNGMVMRNNGPTGAVFIQIGPDFIGAIMQIRTELLPELDDDWRAFLSSTKAEDQKVAS